ncbi:MAB_1171c family putative transporter [Actinoplanes regularis]|uniref:DUF6545 domain-containing protein n=1 Tax=Actinoplanes regularis TaxID=52697 RepID=A0A238XHN6_9ACTN|nr:MAB_1171c family putative transporter [Actinoplanes regularis]GIE86824.1 hypothetical protein Are01nite_33040 [Actinoplanes regularis]SNR58202.1 hypothetical protein SAMN06264365_103450 [Actinoplanes regularis]
MTSLIVTIALWVITLWRVPTVRESRRKRSLWVAFAAMAMAMTLRVNGVENVIDTGTGISGLSLLLKHYAGLVSCAAVLGFVTGLTSRDHERPRIGRYQLAAAVTAVALSIIFAMMPSIGSSDFMDNAAGQLMPSVYLLVFFSYLCTAMAAATVRFWQARDSAHRMLRIGLTVLATGSGLGAAYAGYRIAFVLTRLVGTLPGGDDPWIAVSDAMKYLAILLIVIGCSLPAAELTGRHYRHWLALHQLRPLWGAVTAAAPQIVLDRPSRLTDLTDPRDLRMRVVRRAGEIRDAALMLRGWTDTDLPHAVQALSEADLSGIPVQAAAEAALLRMALANRQQATPDATAPGTTTRNLLSGGDDFDTELAWLRHVANAFEHPAVIRAAQRMNTVRATS